MLWWDHPAPDNRPVRWSLEAVRSCCGHVRPSLACTSPVCLGLACCHSWAGRVLFLNFSFHVLKTKMVIYSVTEGIFCRDGKKKKKNTCCIKAASDCFHFFHLKLKKCEPCFAWILNMFVNNDESLCSVLHFTKLLYMHFIEGGLQNSCLCSKTLSWELQCVWREGSGCREPLCTATGPPSAPAESCRISFLFQGKQKWFPVSGTFHSGACLGTGNPCLCFVCFSWGKLRVDSSCQSEGEELWVSRAELYPSPPVS